MRGMDPRYLAKLDKEQSVWAITAYGKFFLDNFVFLKGNHCFVIGTTGSGKTNLGEWLVSWLKHTETQIWLDSGKSDEIVPLLCQEMPVQLIVPKYTDVIIEERVDGKWQPIKDHPRVVPVPDAGDTWWAVKKKTINILCFRNAFWSTTARAVWMSELFETLATWTRLRKMPSINPCSIHIDESQWAIAGTRISRDSARVQSSEIITENALEGRSSGERLILYSQDFTNIPPAIRENLVCAILLRGADVDSSQSKKLSPHCNTPPGTKRPANFQRGEGKFVSENGIALPNNKTWRFPLFPKSEEDRNWCKRCRVRYVGFNDQRPSESEVEEECQPELGRFSAMAIPPEKVEGLMVGRWDVNDGI